MLGDARVWLYPVFIGESNGFSCLSVGAFAKSISRKSCFLPKGSHAYPSSVMIFFKWNLYREVSLCLSEQNVWTENLGKVYRIKNCDQRKMLDLIAFVYKRRDTSFVTYHLSYTQIGHFMGRETVYLCYDFPEVLQRWWDGIQTKSERGTFQHTSYDLEKVSMMSASGFLWPTVNH